MKNFLISKKISPLQMIIVITKGKVVVKNVSKLLLSKFDTFF